MAYYVSVIENGRGRKALALGPFRRHGDALSHVDGFRRWASDHIRDAHWHAYGTAHDRNGHAYRGKMNEHYPNVTVDHEGWCER